MTYAIKSLKNEESVVLISVFFKLCNRNYAWKVKVTYNWGQNCLTENLCKIKFLPFHKYCVQKESLLWVCLDSWIYHKTWYSQSQSSCRTTQSLYLQVKIWAAVALYEDLANSWVTLQCFLRKPILLHQHKWIKR